jgi:hypothetical protein
MWAICDHDGPALADKVYGYLFKNGDEQPGFSQLCMRQFLVCAKKNALLTVGCRLSISELEGESRINFVGDGIHSSAQYFNTAIVEILQPIFLRFMSPTIIVLIASTVYLIVAC